MHLKYLYLKLDIEKKFWYGLIGRSWIQMELNFEEQSEFSDKSSQIIKYLQLCSFGWMFIFSVS